MKIHGKVINKLRIKESTVKINGQETTFKLGAVPISFSISLNAVLPPPVPPTEGKIARDEKTNKPLKHPVTGKPFKRALADDSNYKRKAAEHGVMVMIYMLYTSIKAGDPTQLEFDIEAEYDRDGRLHDEVFVKALEREMSLAGFEFNSIVQLCNAVQSLNSMGDLTEVLESDFSSPSPEAQMTSESPSSSEVRDSGGANSTGSSEHVNSSGSTPEGSTTSHTNGEDAS